MSAAAILYIRHGESTWNAAGRWQGQADPPLSARGRQQVAELARRLAERPAPALLASSDLRRAWQTAEALGWSWGLVPRAVPELRELDAGAWSGLRHDEVERRWPEELRRFREGEAELRVGGGESRNGLRLRVQRALQALAAEAGSGGLAVVGHLGALRSLLPGVALENAEFRELPLTALGVAEAQYPEPVGSAAGSGPHGCGREDEEAL